MKSSHFCKLLCMLLAVVFLTGCTEKEFDPEADNYAVVKFHLNTVQLINAEGKELHWSENVIGDRILPLLGTMPYSDCISHLSSSGYVDVTVPYSKSFTIRPKLPQHGTLPDFHVEFYKSDMIVGDVEVSCAFEGDVTIYDNNVVELAGNGPGIIVYFTLYEKESQGSDDSREKYQYTLRGSNEKHAKLRLAGDKIVAEGMVGDYTVTKSERIRSESDSLGNWEEVYTKTYSEDGKEKTAS